MPFGVRFQYDQPSERDSGWSSGFYNTATTLQTAVDRAKAFAQLLKNLTGGQTLIKFIKVHGIGQRRVSQTIRFAGTPTAASSKDAPQAEGPDSDVPKTGFLLQMYNADLSGSASICIRGIPDIWTTKGGFFTGAGNSDKVLGAVKKHVTDRANGWVLQNLDPARAFQPILDISEVGNVTVAAPMTFADPPLVDLHRVKGLGTTSRRFRVVNNSGINFTLFPFKTQPEKPELGLGSAAFVVKYKYTEIDSVIFDRSATREVGRPPDSATGRRKARAT